MTALEPCYRHADRPTGTHCTRCGNPTCGDCMITAPVGHHCPGCVAAAGGDMQKVRRVTWAQPRTGAVVSILLVANVVAHLLSSWDPTILPRFANQRAGVLAGEYYRLLTSTVLHVGLLHLAVNCLSLAVVGVDLEGYLGKPRFLALYLLCGLGGSVATFLVGPASSVGASGAIFGLMGALFAISRRRRFDTSRVAGIIVLNLVAGFAIPGINVVSHLGGLVTGFLLGTALEWAQGRSRRTLRDAGVMGVASVGLLAVVAAGVWRSPQPPNPVETVMETQLEALMGVGLSREAVLANPPVVIPPYQAIADGAATYDAYDVEDPSRARAIVIEFGDGSKARATLPAGSGVKAVRFRHQFPRHLARFEQRLALDEAADPFAARTVTDVCPQGTAEAKERDDDASVGDAEGPPMCVRSSSERGEHS